MVVSWWIVVFCALSSFNKVIIIYLFIDAILVFQVTCCNYHIV